MKTKKGLNKILFSVCVAALFALGFSLPYIFTSNVDTIGGRTFVPRASSLQPIDGMSNNDIIKWDAATESFIAASSTAGGGGASLGAVPAGGFLDMSFEDASGAVSATGSITLTGDPSLLSSFDVITINDGTTTSTITFNNLAGGGTTAIGTTATVDNGGGPSKEAVVYLIGTALSKLGAIGGTTIRPYCDSHFANIGGFSPNAVCLTEKSDGTATSTVMFLYNSNPGASGNQNIIVSSTLLTATGMSGGSN